ncbi:MAG: thioredoxin-disulfide reductase [bacterium]
MTEKKAHDLVIIGGGPGGLAAGLYASRARMDTLLLEKAAYGGQMLTTFFIENYPGFPEGIAGFELADLMKKQTDLYGLQIQTAEVRGVVKEGNVFDIDTIEGTVRSRAVIVSTGADPDKLGVPGEERLAGRGVSYCATCDGALYRERTVAVVGGGDSAIEETLFLTRFADRIHVIHRRDELRATPISRERAFANEKIVFEWNTVLKEILGEDEVTGLLLENVKTGQTRKLAAAGVFIYVGITPQSSFLENMVEKNEGGYIKTDLTMSSSVPGLFAIGDVRAESVRQVASAVGDGVTAAIYAYKYLVE